MHLFSRKKVELPKRKPIGVYVQVFAESADEVTVVPFQHAPFTPRVNDFSIESLQNSGIQLQELNQTYINSSLSERVDMIARATGILSDENSAAFTKETKTE